MKEQEHDDFWSAEEFELDFCTAIAMMEGKSYAEAVVEAKEMMKEARE